ncbi:hypothetical protein N5079_29435 [Planotetraspora sp. A-T 1434]|uniref:hypothetical protein n=1 Tax=Planotetraspora sp. A-T 1434 TaxID=2979219 RepID=UPI0021C0ABB1|nr:hypothetical protein [Planotetraspora sp. A-T 1434]MCT9934334.1 hypothetical protein [Planotetraspora sp. A-T 1434]
MRRALVALVMGMLVGLLLPTSSAMAHAAGAAEAAGGEAVRAQGGQVVLIGVPGLMWSDVTPSDTPNLWSLAGSSALGSLSVRTVGNITCPYDGWLTVSAGVRSAVGHRCGLPPAPAPQGEGAVVPDLSLLPDESRRYAGTLGQAVHDARQCTMAVGPGAALALADRQGKVDVYAGTPAKVADWARCPVVAVDLDDVAAPYIEDGKVTLTTEKLAPEARRALVRAADAKLAAVLPHLRASTILVAGLSDHGPVPHLRAAMLYGPALKTGGAQAFTLGARSTHRDDMLIVPDLTATMLNQVAGSVPATVVGVPAETHAAGERTVAQRVDALKIADVAGQTIRNMGGVFFTSLAVLQVLFYVTAFLLLRRREGLGGVRIAAVALASIPVSTYLVNLTPWARTAQPTLVLVAAILATAAVLSVIALAGPWRRSVLGPPVVVAAVTAGVLLADLLTGTPLQLNSVMGYTGVVGARYYGLGNIPFALLATAVLLVTTAIADGLARSGHKVLGVGLVAGLGCFAMLLDGWPGVGSDFGGVIAFVPGIAVAALLVAGKRVSVVRLGAFCVAGGVVVMAIAYLDYLRPAADQTHLGRFVGQVLDGTFLPVISRKLGAMLHTLISPNLMPVVIAAFAFLIFALFRPGAASAGVLPVAFERAPMLKAGLLGALVSGVVGMLVNDSGAAVLSMALALAVPLVLSAGIRALQVGEPVSGPAPRPEPSPAP